MESEHKVMNQPLTGDPVVGVMQRTVSPEPVIAPSEPVKEAREVKVKKEHHYGRPI